VYQAFRQHEESLNFAKESVRLNVVPTYMGLIKQIDDQLGRLFDTLQSSGRWDDTLIVFTSDHGDYLGDHCLGEKEILLEPAVGVPLIVRDPRAAADATRGQVDQRLVETIDALPTFLQALGLPAADLRLEGRSRTQPAVVVIRRQGSGRHGRCTTQSAGADCMAVLQSIWWLFHLSEDMYLVHGPCSNDITCDFSAC